MLKKYIILKMMLSILMAIPNNSLLSMTCCSINPDATTSIPTLPTGVNSVAFTSSGCLATTNVNGELNIYSPTSDDCTYNTIPSSTISVGSTTNEIASSSNGCLAIATSTGVSILVPSGSCPNCVYDETPATTITTGSNTTAVAFSNTNCLASGDSAGRVNIYSPTSSNDCTYNTTPTTSFTVPSATEINSLTFSLTNNCLIVGDNSGAVNIYAPVNGCDYATTPSQTLTLPASVNSVAVSAQGCLAIADNTGEVTIYEPGAGCTYTLTTTIINLVSPSVIAFSPTGCLAIGNHDGTLDVYSPTTGCIYNAIASSVISGDTPISSVAFSANGCLAGGSANSVNVYGPNATLTASISPLVSLVCTGSTVNLTAIPAGGAVPFTYTWTFPDGSTTPPSSSNTLTIPNMTQQNSGLYTVTVTDSSGCTTTAMAFVAVESLTASLQATPSAICSGQSSILSTNISGGVPPFQVTFSGFPPISTSNRLVTQTVMPTTTTDYTVQIVDSKGCTTTIGPVTVTVEEPIAPMISNVSVSCNGTITITGTAGDNNTIEVFNGTNEIAVPVMAAADGSFSITTISLSPGTYSNLSVAASVNFNCSLSTTIPTVIIPSVPSVSISPNPDIVCAGSDIILTATGAGGTAPYAFAWTGPAGFTGSVDTITIPAATRANAGIYHVTLTDSNGCTSTAITLVRVIDIGVTISSSTQFLCNGESATLTAHVTSGVAPYTFTFQPDGFIVTTPDTIVTDTVTPNTTTTYSVSVQDSTPCTATSAPVTVIVSVVTPPSNLTATSNCNGIVRVTGTAAPGNTITIYNGSVAVGGPIVVPGSGNFSVNTTSLPAGTYSLDVTATNLSACTATTTAPTVVVNAPFSVSIIPQSQSIALGATLMLMADTSGGAAGTTNYNWTGPNGFTQNGPSNVVIRTNATSAFGGTYTVLATDSAGCTATSNATVTVL